MAAPLQRCTTALCTGLPDPGAVRRIPVRQGPPSHFSQVIRGPKNRGRSQPKVLFQTEILHLSSIFPADFLRMASLQTDVLVTHEAPSCHPYGHAGIDHLARSMGAKLVIHGHHHDSLDYSGDRERMGFACVGVGFRGITELDLDTLVTRCVRAGDYDAERQGRNGLIIPDKSGH
jgi:hypothetical protein